MAPARDSPRHASGALKIFILRSLLPLLLVVAWLVASLKFDVDTYYLPSPIRVWRALTGLIAERHLQIGIWASFRRLVLATTISCAISLPIGILMGSSDFFRNLLSPLVKLRYLPTFLLLPFLIFLFGVEESSKITFLVLSIIFFFLPSVMAAVALVPRRLREASLTLGATRSQVVFRVVLPAALPDICQSFLVVNGVGWNALMAAEVINAREGLGYLMNIARQRGQVEIMIITLIVVYIIALGMDWTIERLIKRAFPWRTH